MIIGLLAALGIIVGYKGAEAAGQQYNNHADRKLLKELRNR